VLGICNGFQIACEAGLLPGALLRNFELKYISEFRHLRVENTDTIFTSEYDQNQVVRIPIAHGDGRYTADDETVARLEGEGRVVFRYCAPDGSVAPENAPNGAMHGIAGIINDRGNVLGMMPHPERAMESLVGSADGAALFQSMLARVGV
jgi:phosphoribosylformylglycinamidine synthase